MPGPLFPAAARRRPGFGISLPSSGPFATAENIYAFAERADACGFDDVWVNDHYSYLPKRHRLSAAGTIDAVGVEEPNFFESLVTLAAVGARQRAIGVAMHALVLPLRHPVLAAKQIAAIQELSGRGITVAPGIGGSPEDFDAIGVRMDRRGRLLDEHLAVLEALFTQPAPVSFSGKYVSFTNASLFPSPRSIQLWVTGDGEACFARVARYGTGWFSGHGTVHDFEARSAQLDTVMEEAGRDPASIERASDLLVCVAATHDEAMRMGRLTFEKRRGSFEKALERDAIGSPEEVTELLARRLAQGRTYLELRIIAPTVPSSLEMIDRLARDVLPNLRGSATLA